MLDLTGSLGHDKDMDLMDMLNLVQDQKNIIAMLQRFEAHQMTALEEISFFQYLVDSGIVWAMPSNYVKRAEEYLEKRMIYFN